MPDRTASPVQQLHSFLSLPPELALPILHRCHNRDLLAIACTCRALNYTVIPIYLSRFNAQDVLYARELIIDCSNIRNVLRGLESSLTLPILDHLFIKFHGYPRGAPRILSFVSRFKFIREVTVHVGFAHVESADGISYSRRRQYWHPDQTRLVEILAKSKCEVLNVRGGFTGPPTRLEIEQKELIPEAEPRASFCRRISSAVTFRLGIFSPTGVKKMPSDTFPLTSLDNSSLQTFRLDSNLFFTDPSHSCLMGTLTTTSITSLSLEADNVLPPVWGSFLYSITLPALTEISFHTRDIPFAELLTFVSRHSSLMIVSLEPYFIITHPVRRKWLAKQRKLSLPRLHSISGHPENVKLFLSCSKRTPHLRHISLTLPSCESCDPDTLIKVVAAAIKVPMRHPPILTLRFSLSPYSSDCCASWENVAPRSRAITLSNHWMHKILQYLGYRTPTVEVVRLESERGFPFCERVLPSLLRWLPTFQRVSIAKDFFPSDTKRRSEAVEAIRATGLRFLAY